MIESIACQFLGYADKSHLWPKIGPQNPPKGLYGVILTAVCQLNRFPPFSSSESIIQPSCPSYCKSLVKQRGDLPSSRMKNLGHSCRPLFSKWRKGSLSVVGQKSWCALQAMTIATHLIMMVLGMTMVLVISL